jgi:sigma-B regulation protein RsbU (phosphoserine phosphatase)
LDNASGTAHRVWLVDDGAIRLAAGVDPGWAPAPPDGAGLASTPAGLRWLAPVPGTPGLWLDLETSGNSPSRRGLADLELLGHLVSTDREVLRLSQELASRYEEIDLLYTISEILGQTVKLEQAAQIIVRAVSSVVGARRASIVVVDESAGVLRTVAAQGLPLGRSGIIRLDDPESIAARVFRERRALIGDPSDGLPSHPDKVERGYQGAAFMSVPICYTAAGQEPRCIGVVNLTDRIGGDRFSTTDRKLVVAVANQIGAALENARLVARERDQERLEQELDLAHHLQQSLLPRPTVLQGDALVGVRCLPLRSVGGDFYTFSRLGLGSVGVMLGDVSSHGFAAALLMASVMSAVGIHASVQTGPDEILAALRDGLSDELATSESYLTVFYGILDPGAERLVYANAGHPYAFRIPAEGDPVRLDATAPPLGLDPAGSIASRALGWDRERDLLCLFTDGLADAASPTAGRFGEQRLVDAVAARRALHPEAIVAAVMAEVDAFAPSPSDDRTLLVLKVGRPG